MLADVWSIEDLCRAAADGLAARAEELRLEQAVRGLDSLAEVDLHPLLHRAFAAEGWGVLGEQPYPGEPERRPAHARRERCDLVLTPRSGQRLVDPVAELKEHDKAVGTLFEASATRIKPPIATDRVTVDEVFWLEVKSIGQFTYTRGVPGPNRAYASELVSGPAADAVKLEWDPRIASAGILVVLFTADEATARHDLGVMMHRLLDRELPVLAPAVRSVPIPDLIGNRACTAALIPVSKPPPAAPGARALRPEP